MKIELKDKTLPRNDKGDVCFTSFSGEENSLVHVFTLDEIVELCNRALYQLEYQKESHRKRGMLERARNKALKEEMKKAGIKPLKGE